VPFDPLIVAWGTWCLGIAWASRWWTLPAWSRGSGVQCVQNVAGLIRQLSLLALVTYFLPLRYVGVAVAVLLVELVPFAAQRLRRAQRAASSLTAAR
jgi:hypothetical protein